MHNHKSNANFSHLHSGLTLMTTCQKNEFWNFANLGNYKIKICQGLLLHWRYVRLVSMCQQGWMKNGEKKQESVNSCRRNDRDASTNTWRCHGTNTYLRGKKYFLPSAADKKLPGQSRIVRVWKRRQREGRGNLIIATQRHKEIRIKAFPLRFTGEM